MAASSADDVAAYFGATVTGAELAPSWNKAPTDDVYAVVEGAEGTAAAGERLLETFHWGLVPMWADDVKIGNRMINARAETLARNNAFRKAFARRRCIVPADGFYEWRAPEGGGRKQPYYVHREDGEPLALAGLWERWRGPDGDADDVLHSCTIVTTDANGLLADVHDRMPVVLPASAWDDWLDPDIGDVETLSGLLRPAPDDLLTLRPVDPAVGNVRNDGPELVDAVDP